MTTAASLDNECAKPLEPQHDIMSLVEPILQVANKIEKKKQKLAELIKQHDTYNKEYLAIPETVNTVEKSLLRRKRMYAGHCIDRAKWAIEDLQEKYVALLPKEMGRIKRRLMALQLYADAYWDLMLHLPTKKKDIIELFWKKQRPKKTKVIQANKWSKFDD